MGPGALPAPPQELKNNFFNIGDSSKPHAPPAALGAPPQGASSFFYSPDGAAGGPHGSQSGGIPHAPPGLPPHASTLHAAAGPLPHHYPSQDPSRMGATQQRTHIQQ